MLVRSSMGDLTPEQDAAVRLQARETFRQQVLNEDPETAARNAAQSMIDDGFVNVVSTLIPATSPAAKSSPGRATAAPTPAPAAGGGDNTMLYVAGAAAAVFGYLLLTSRRGRR